MQEYYIKTSSNICFGYLLELPHWGDSNKYPKHVLCGNKNKTRSFLHTILSIKDSLQQQIHFNGNFLGNKCCRRNEGSLYLGWLWCLQTLYNYKTSLHSLTADRSHDLLIHNIIEASYVEPTCATMQAFKAFNIHCMMFNARKRPFILMKVQISIHVCALFKLSVPAYSIMDNEENNDEQRMPWLGAMDATAYLGTCCL